MSCTCNECSCSSCGPIQTFRNAVLPALSAADAVVGMLDLAPIRISVITRQWAGGRRGVGPSGDTVLQLPNWIVVQEITEQEVEQSGGRFETGDIRVGPIRPYFTTVSCNGVPGTPGGFTSEQLVPKQPTEATDVFYRAQQAHGLGTGLNGDYSLYRFHTDDPLAFYMVLRRHNRATDPIAPIAL